MGNGEWAIREDPIDNCPFTIHNSPIFAPLKKGL